MEAKKLLADEKEKTENGKASRQPINSKMDDVLKNNGIDRATQFVGNVEGNGARTLMEKRALIIDYMIEDILEAPTRVAGTEDEIQHVGEIHQHLLLFLNEYLSGLRTKRFCLTSDILGKTKQYRD